jgi:nitronate monooxygenase
VRAGVTRKGLTLDAAVLGTVIDRQHGQATGEGALAPGTKGPRRAPVSPERVSTDGFRDLRTVSLPHSVTPPWPVPSPVTAVASPHPPEAMPNRQRRCGQRAGAPEWGMELLGLPLRWPILGAPMAGGPSTPALAAAVSNAGGLGFLAGGYLTAELMEHQMGHCRQLTGAPFGVNLFVPQSPDVDQVALDAYLGSLHAEADALGVEVVASWDDDGWAEKLAVLRHHPVPVVSFTFGCPPPELISELQNVGSRVVITVTTPDEATMAAAAGADAVTAQGIEAGGHQGTFSDDGVPDTGWSLMALVRAVHRAVSLPVIAAGGLMTGTDVAAVMGAGAVAGQLGTALLRCPESGTSELYKSALSDPTFETTAITRAFSGRRARGLVNDFMRSHGDAPSAYPHINNATRALRRASVAGGNPQGTNLWAGEGFRRAQDRPAADIVGAIGVEVDSLS